MMYELMCEKMCEQADWSHLGSTGGVDEEGRLGQSARRGVDMVASRDADYHAMCSRSSRGKKTAREITSRGEIVGPRYLDMVAVGRAPSR